MSRSPAPGRYQRRISRLTAQVSAVARELAGRASARLLPALGIMVSRHTALRVLLKIALPEVAMPRVLGTGGFALRRGLVYATVLIDAETGRRVGVVPGRTAGVTEKWLLGHPGVEVVCRDGCGVYGEAASRALPSAVQAAGPYRGYLRKRRAEQPGAPVQQLLREIRERGYQGSSNLLARYINQRRADSGRPHLSPRRPPASCSPGQTATPAARLRPSPTSRPPAPR